LPIGTFIEDLEYGEGSSGFYQYKSTVDGASRVEPLRIPEPPHEPSRAATQNEAVSQGYWGSSPVLDETFQLDEWEHFGDPPAQKTVASADKRADATKAEVGSASAAKHHTDSPRRSSIIYAVIGFIVLLVLIMAVVGGVCGSGKCGGGSAAEGAKTSSSTGTPPSPTVSSPPSPSSSTVPPIPEESQTTIAQIRRRGALNCGIPDTTLPGDEVSAGVEEPTGFSVDLVRLQQCHEFAFVCFQTSFVSHHFRFVIFFSITPTVQGIGSRAFWSAGWL
jgi:hypothetical protein